jgi:hypothetical protein
MTNRNCPSASYRQVARVRVRLARAPTRMATTEDSPSRSYQAVYHHESGMATIGTAASPPTSRYHHQILAPTPHNRPDIAPVRYTCASSGAGTLEPLEPGGSCGRLLQVFRQRAASFLARARQRWDGAAMDRSLPAGPGGS